MIYTVTFNPSIDYTVELDKLTAGSLNRCKEEYITFGGKGLNVSAILSELDIPTKALGFCAGSTGRLIAEQLSAAGIESDLVELSSGNSRINVKIKAEEETEINAKGPEISHEELEQFFEKLSQVTDGDTLVLAGSIPKTLPDDIYEQIMARLAGRDIRIVVDAEKRLLLNVLKYHPFLIKPNNHELGDMFGVKLTTDEEILTYARKLQEMGATNVLISMAGDGAMLLTADGQTFRCPAPQGELVNSVGAGDSMVAGFLTGYMESGGDFAQAFHMGVATGSASAFSSELATRPEVEALLKTIQ